MHEQQIIDSYKQWMYLETRNNIFNVTFEEIHLRFSTSASNWGSVDSDKVRVNSEVIDK
jgi:hypothetical protein